MTSPPFGLVRKKEYGNVDADKYVEWFRPFGHLFKKLLKPSGSLVIDIGGAWVPGQPTRSLYHYELLIMLCKEIGFHLAQEFFWWICEASYSRGMGYHKKNPSERFRQLRMVALTDTLATII